MQKSPCGKPPMSNLQSTLCNTAMHPLIASHQFDQVVTLRVCEEALHEEGTGRPAQVHDLAPPLLLHEPTDTQMAQGRRCKLASEQGMTGGRAC